MLGFARGVVVWEVAGARSIGEDTAFHGLGEPVTKSSARFRIRTERGALQHQFTGECLAEERAAGHRDDGPGFVERGRGLVVRAGVFQAHCVQGLGEAIEEPARAIPSESTAGRIGVEEPPPVHQLPGQKPRVPFFAEDVSNFFEEIRGGIALRWGFERTLQILFQFVKRIDRERVEQSSAASKMVQNGGVSDSEVARNRLQPEAVGPLVHQSLLGGVQDFPARQRRRAPPPLRPCGGGIGFFDHQGIKAIFTILSIRLCWFLVTRERFA